MAIKFLSGLNLSDVTAGSILKLDSNGNIVAATAGTDYVASSTWTEPNSGTLYTNKKVGIGYSDAAAKLHVYEYQTTTPKLLIEDGNTGDASMQFKISTQQYTMGIDNSDSDKFVLAASSALGTTNAIEVSTTGVTQFGNDIKLSNGWTLSTAGASYAKFGSWVNIQGTGFYTSTDMYMDLDDSSSRFVIRSEGNTEEFIGNTATDTFSIPNWSFEANDITQTSSGDNWSSTTSTEYNQTGIKLSRTGSGYVSAAPYKLIGSFTASVSFKTSNTTHLGIIFAASESNQDNDNYAVILRNNSPTGTEVRVQKRVNGGQTYPISAVNVTTDCDDGNWHELTVSYNGKHIVVDVDGANYFNQAWTDTSFTSPGLVGVAIYDGTTYFNDFQVTETPSTTTFENLNLANGNRTLDIKLATTPPTGDVGVQFRAGSGDYLGLAAGGGTGVGLVVDSSNNVGIGTTGPAQKLEVVGTIQATSTGTATLILRGDSGNVGDTGQLDSTIKMLHDDGTHGILLETRNYAGKQSFEIKSLTAGTETSRFLIDQDGTLKVPAYGAGFLTTDANGDVSVDTTSYVDSSGDTMTGDLTIKRGHGDLTFLTLKQENTGGDLVEQKSFIDFTFVDSNTNETPQVRIGAEVGNNDGSASSQAEEGMGAFVVYTNNADTDAGAAGASLAERFRVDYQGKAFFTNNVDVNGSITGSTVYTEGSVINASNALELRSDVQHGQGDEDAVISFKQSTNELGKFDQDGYLYATGFKTSGTTGFLKSDGSVDTSTYQASGNYLTSISSSDVTTALGYRPASGAYGAWSSITNGSSGDWFPLFVMDDGGDGSALVIFKTYAHDSVIFTVSRGYNGSNQNTISVLNSVNTPNSGYATVQALRVRNNGWVEAQLVWSTGPSVQASIQVITGDDNEVSIESDLETTQLTTTVNHTVSVNSRGLLHGYTISSTGDITSGAKLIAEGKLYLESLDTNTTSTTALVMNSTEVEKRTLGSLAFNSTTLGTMASASTGDYKDSDTVESYVAQELGSYLPLAGGTMTGALVINEGASDQTNSSDTTTLPSTTGAEFMRIEGAYTDGRYTTELAKVDRGGNLPLYIRQSKSTANSFINLARFGDHSNSVHEFEVFGSIKASGGDSGNWNTAYSWGNHASAGYLTTASAATTYAPLASPALTGTPTAPTAASTTNTTQIATTAFVQTAVSNLVDSAPGTLDTLNELAAALGDDANFSTTVTNSIATKLPLTGGTLTGGLIISDALSSPADLLTLKNTTTTSGASIKFTDQAPTPLQFGRITFYHQDTKSYGSGAAFIIGSDQPNTTILADGKLMYAEGIYSKPSSGTGAGTRKDANWDTAYTYSQVGHLPLSGGTMTGNINLGDNNKVILGAGSDFEMFHNGSNTFLQTTSSSVGDFYITARGTNHDLYLEAADNIYLRPQGNENGIIVVGNGAVQLYYNNAQKFVTTSTGVSVAGKTTSTDQISVNNRTAISVGHWSATNNTTGAIKITLPGSHGGNWSMIVLRITAYEYNSTNHTIYYVSGHDWTSGWYNNGVTKIGDSNKDIKLGYDSNKDYVILGGVSDTWAYGHVTVDVMAHPSFYSSAMDITSGWDVRQTTDLTGITTTAVTNRKVLTTADEGSGNGIDADKVDGLQASSFLRSDTSDEMSGTLTFRNNVSTEAIIRDINFSSSAVNGSDDRAALVRGWTEGGTSTTRGGKLSFYTRTSGTNSFNHSFINQYGDLYVARDIYATNNKVATETFVTTNYKTSDDTETYVAQELTGYTPTSSLGTAAFVASSTFATAAQGTTADAALPKAGGTMTGGLVAGGGISGLTLTNGISGTNFNITGVNQLEIADPGEGIVFKSGSSGDMTLAIVDDSSDNILRFSGTNATFDVAGALTSTNLTIADAIYHEGDTNTSITFGTDTINLNTGGGVRASISDSGAKFNNNTIIAGGATLSLGERAEGDDNGRTVLIEGAANASNGEGAGRIFFTEHNSTDAAADKYGLSLYYEGDPNIALPSGFQPNTGNSTWSLRRHDNSVNGTAIMSGSRTSNNVLFSGTVTVGGALNIPEYIYHNGDSNTYVRFTGDRIRIVAGGSTKFDSNNTYLTSYTETSTLGQVLTRGNSTNNTIHIFHTDFGYTFQTDVNWGGWARTPFYFEDGSGNGFGGLGAYGGNGTTLSKYYIGTAYNNNIIEFHTDDSVIMSGDLTLPEKIIHSGDADTYIKFDTNRVRIVAGNITKFDSDTIYTGTVQSVTGTGTVSGLSLSDDGDPVDPTLTLSGTISISSANITDVAANADATPSWVPATNPNYLTSYTETDTLASVTGRGASTTTSLSIRNLTSRTILPEADRTYDLGGEETRWRVVFCETLDSAGQHESNLQDEEQPISQYATGTVLSWKGGKNRPCTQYADHMRMGIAVEGQDSPLIQGAEPVLVTGVVEEGDYLVTSDKEGHAVAVPRNIVKEQMLFDCVIGKALESGEGDSHLIKTWINI